MDELKIMQQINDFPFLYELNSGFFFCKKCTFHCEAGVEMAAHLKFEHEIEWDAV